MKQEMNNNFSNELSIECSGNMIQYSEIRKDAFDPEFEAPSFENSFKVASSIKQNQKSSPKPVKEFEPLPLFECIFCVKEGLVFNRLISKGLVKRYNYPDKQIDNFSCLEDDQFSSKSEKLSLSKLNSEVCTKIKQNGFEFISHPKENLYNFLMRNLENSFYPKLVVPYIHINLIMKKYKYLKRKSDIKYLMANTPSIGASSKFTESIVQKANSKNNFIPENSKNEFKLQIDPLNVSYDSDVHNIYDSNSSENSSDEENNWIADIRIANAKLNFPRTFIAPSNIDVEARAAFTVIGTPSKIINISENPSKIAKTMKNLKNIKRNSTVSDNIPKCLSVNGFKTRNNEESKKVKTINSESKQILSHNIKKMSEKAKSIIQNSNKNSSIIHIQAAHSMSNSSVDHKLASMSIEMQTQKDLNLLTSSIKSKILVPMIGKNCSSLANYSLEKSKRMIGLETTRLKGSEISIKKKVCQSRKMSSKNVKQLKNHTIKYK